MNPDQQSNYWTPDPETPQAPQVAQPQVPAEADRSPAAPSQAPIEPINDPAPHIREDEAISWQASEYIHMERNALWFVSVVAVGIVLLALSIFLMKAWTFSVLVVVMVVAVLVLAKRPPRVLKYTLSSKGLYVMDQLHPLSEYKSFGIIRDEGEYSVMLTPIKRFSPGLTVYFPANMGEKIVDFLGRRLPMQDLQLDVVDKIVRKLRL